MRVILFDIDGTLLSSSHAGKAALEKAMVDLHGVPDSMAGISLAGRTDRSIVRDLTRAHRVGEGRPTEDAILEGYLSYLSFFGINDRFSFGGFGDHHFDRDEVAREAWGEVVGRFGSDLQPDQVLVIGDTPLDVQCARAIGARVLAVATGVHTLQQLAQCQPDYCLPDLANHSRVIEACLGR